MSLGLDALVAAILEARIGRDAPASVDLALRVDPQKFLSGLHSREGHVKFVSTIGATITSGECPLPPEAHEDFAEFGIEVTAFSITPREVAQE